MDIDTSNKQYALDTVIESFKSDFEMLKSKGFIESMRISHTGIGKTCEELIGIPENNSKLADYKGILEIKSSREFSKSMITLFTKSPSSSIKVSSYLREKYGRPDKNFPEIKVLRFTAEHDDYKYFDNSYGFKINIDEKDRRLNLLINSIDGELLEIGNIYYDLGDLKEIINSKLKYIAYIKAETIKGDKIEKFKFKEAKLLSGLNFDKFILAIKEGIIDYDIRLGVYGKKSKTPGKLHDHGFAFRIKKKRISDIFDITDIN